MKRGRLGNLFVMSAMIGGMAQAFRAAGSRSTTRRYADRSTELQRELIARAEAKRARKAAKLREHGL